MGLASLRRAARGTPQRARLVRAIAAAAIANRRRFERISAIRKTPEGWSMTLFRMRQYMAWCSMPMCEIPRAYSRYQGLALRNPRPAVCLEQRPNAQDIDLGRSWCDVRQCTRSRVSCSGERGGMGNSRTPTRAVASSSISSRGATTLWDIASGLSREARCTLSVFHARGATGKTAGADLTAIGDRRARPRRPGFFGTADHTRRQGDYTALYRMTDVDGATCRVNPGDRVHGYEWRAMRHRAALPARGFPRLRRRQPHRGRWFYEGHARMAANGARSGTPTSRVLACCRSRSRRHHAG